MGDDHGHYDDYEEVIDEVDELRAEEEKQAKVAEALKRSASESKREQKDVTQSQMDQDDINYDEAQQKEVDNRSVYVGNVEYSVTSADLAEFFGSCGTVQRVTIPGDSAQHPKGYAYVEFMEPEAVENALKLEDSEVGGRPIKVARKRTNQAGFVRGRGRGRGGRGGRGRGGRVPWGVMPMMMPGFLDPYSMSGGYSPYRGAYRGGRGARAGRRGATRGRTPSTEGQV